ncbi:F0F1 ATP synthase subunit alpha [Candidatus Dependentiae bacterium]|nr:F0F1 ATP synthase subunit alpha [Candidatus Dependentiae bacterium]
MQIKNTDLVKLFQEALTNTPQQRLQQTGMVMQVGDGICRVSGLDAALFSELVHFEGGNQGIVFNLDEEFVSIFLLSMTIPVIEGEVVRLAGSVFKTPVGTAMLGRVVNALGAPIDALGAIAVDEERPVEHVAPGVIERSPINQSLETGMMVVDALVPVGRGQRELIIGNRSSGKTSLAVDTIINQRGKNVVCIYVSIGQRQANVARLVQLLQAHGALEYSIIVSADASDPVLCQYLAPYVGCTIAEYFKDLGRDVLIIYDDLTNHAIAYREMSLLLRRAPGREAYPGDVFYLHSRLLERAGKFLGKGSITALPIVQIQNDDITAYIPTNLISITDGQIFLDTKLFNQGVRPAVNVELSVSRVGGAAQTAAIKKMARSLRLELAQYHELQAFAQFGTELDEVSQQHLARGARVVELLKQNEHEIYNFVEQSLMLFLLNQKFLDALPLHQIHDFAVQFVSFVRSVYSELYGQVLESKKFTDEQLAQLLIIAQEFAKIYTPQVV